MDTEHGDGSGPARRSCRRPDPHGGTHLLRPDPAALPADRFGGRR